MQLVGHPLILMLAGPRLGIPIMGSNFWDPYWRQNSDSVSDAGYSGRIFFKIPLLESHPIEIPICKIWNSSNLFT
jgi:hypothetical protein